MKKNSQTNPKKLPNKKLQEALRKNLSRRKQTDEPQNIKEDNQKND